MVHLRAKYFEAKVKKRLALATAFILIGLLVVVVLPRLITINHYKQKITQLLSDHTGLDVDIKGDISLTVLPDFGMTVHDMAISGSILPDKIQTASTHVDALTLKLRLIPLLKGLLQFDSIVIDHPVISVLLPGTEKEGATQHILKKKTAQPAETENEKILSEEASVSMPLGDATHLQPAEHALTIKEFRIHEGEVQLKHPDWNMPLTINNIEIRASLDDAKAPFSVKGNVLYLEKEHTAVIEGGLVWTDGQYGADQFTFQLDDLKGYGKVDIDMRGAVPDLKILVNSERLDLDHFLPGDADKATPHLEQADSQADATLWNKEPVSFSFLHSINAHVNIGIGALHYKTFKFKNVVSNTHLGHGRLTSECKAGVVEGEFTSKLSVDATSAIPALEHTLVLEQVDVSAIPLAPGLHQNLSGILNVSMELTTSGNSPFEWANHLGGEGILNILQGKIKGIDIQSMSKNMTGAFQSIGKEDVATEFDKIHASFAINQGVVHNDDLAVETGGLQFSGEGLVNIPQLTVNYRLVSKLGGGVLKDNTINIPILVKGSLLHPQFSADVVSPILNLVEDPTKAENLIHDLKENLKNQKGNIKKDLKQELQRMIPKGF